MVPIAVQKIIIGSAPGPSILVLQPIEESPVPGISRIVPIMVGAAEAAQLHLAVTHTKVARPRRTTCCSMPSPTLMQASTTSLSTR